ISRPSTRCTTSVPSGLTCGGVNASPSPSPSPVPLPLVGPPDSLKLPPSIALHPESALAEITTARTKGRAELLDREVVQRERGLYRVFMVASCLCWCST